jgi:hypothetical protein
VNTVKPAKAGNARDRNFFPGLAGFPAFRGQKLSILFTITRTYNIIESTFHQSMIKWDSKSGDCLELSGYFKILKQYL